MKKPITKKQITDLNPDEDELFDAFADLVLLGQEGEVPDLPITLDSVQTASDFELIAPELIESLFVEDYPGLVLLNYEFAPKKISGKFQQDGKTFSFELTETDKEWTQTIKEDDSNS